MLDDFATRTIFTVETTQSGMDSLCLRSDNRKEDAMNQKKQKKKRRKPDYTTQGSVVG